MWVLLIEDEVDLSQSLKHGLEEEGYTVDQAYDGQQGELLASINDYDLLIVDWRLPRRDGISVVQHLRAQAKTYPILMLTALGDVHHRVGQVEPVATDLEARIDRCFDADGAVDRLRDHAHAVPQQL